MKSTTFRVPVYSDKVTVITLSNNKEWQECIDKFKIRKEVEELADSKTFPSRALTVEKQLNGGAVIWFIILTLKTEDDIIVHESDHLTSGILKTSGVEPDWDNDEPHAYLIGNLFKRIKKIHDRHKGIQDKPGSRVKNDPAVHTGEKGS